jgi:hypothetical protein
MTQEVYIHAVGKDPAQLRLPEHNHVVNAHAQHKTFMGRAIIEGGGRTLEIGRRIVRISARSRQVHRETFEIGKRAVSQSSLVSSAQDYASYAKRS